MANRRSGDGWASPERRMVWTEPKHNKLKQKQVVGVVYYLCRRQDGQLDHPHFVHVPCLSDSGSDTPRLHLRDVIARLSELRGAAMPAAYSWSAKRTYRNAGYVWQDLTADDLILPASNHHEYVLKGSPLLLADSTTAAPRKQNKHKRWTSLDLADYHHRSNPAPAQLIGIDEISSPPPSSSSPDTVDVASAAVTPQGLTIGGCGGGGRMRASAMLMQLISCGGGSMKEQGQPQRSLPPPSDDSHNSKPDIEQRDYFSGSLVETSSSKSKTTSDRIELSLRRSSSCNADRGASSRLGLVDGKSTAARRNMDRRQMRS